MARGFESKDVEFQQAEAERGRTLGRSLTHAERDALNRRRTIELSLTRTRQDLALATSTDHRRMLEQAIGALEAELHTVFVQ